LTLSNCVLARVVYNSQPEPASRQIPVKKLTPIIFCLLPALLWCGQGLAISDEQFESIKKLGNLNGVALHCGYLEETKRMKTALIDSLPKRRELGLAFDQITHESFMEFIQEQRSCPSAGEFSLQVEQAIERLEAIF